MFFENIGTVQVVYTVAVQGMEPVQEAYKSRPIIPARAQIDFRGMPDGRVLWWVRIQGSVQRKDGSAGEVAAEHGFSSSSLSFNPAPAEVLALVERFRPGAESAIAAGREA